MNKLVLALLSLAACAVCLAADPPAWREAQTPFRIYGNAYYVGVRGLGSILITSEKGHILIDGTMPDNASKIAASIRQLGFRVEDVKLILNTHAHFDHAGGIAELQRLSGARVAASAASAEVLRAGESGADDPQFGILPSIPKVARVQVFKDGETLHVGPLAITAHLTPGHTRGGTSWTWKSCEAERCLNMVYADSMSAVSAPSFKFTNAPTNPHVLQDFEQSFATVSALPCDLLITPHPEVSDLWGRLERREHGERDALLDTHACEKYVDVFRERLRKRVAEERSQ